MSVLVYVLNFLLLGALVWAMYRQAWARSLGPYFFPALAFKMVCGVLLGLLYSRYYDGGDTITYFNASLILSNYAQHHPLAYLQLIFFNTFESEEFRAAVPFSQFPGFTNSFFFIKLLSLLNFLTNSAYYLNAFYLSLFSFWGAGRLASVLMRKVQISKGAIIAFLFFPSVVFWSSGLSKDTLMFGSMCWVMAFAISVAWRQHVAKLQILLAVVMVYLFVKIKLFFAAVILPLLLLYMTVQRMTALSQQLRRPSRQIEIFSFLFCCGIAILYMLQQYLPMEFLLEQSMLNYQALLKRSLHGPHIVLENLQPSIGSMISNLPKALLSAIYRPFLGETAEPFVYIIVGFENLLLLLLTILAFASVTAPSKQNLTLLHVLFLLLVLILGGIIGLTTPNFGSLNRYRLIFLPFLVYLLLQNRFAQRLLQRIGL